MVDLGGVLGSRPPAIGFLGDDNGVGVGSIREARRSALFARNEAADTISGLDESLCCGFLPFSNVGLPFTRRFFEDDTGVCGGDTY